MEARPSRTSSRVNTSNLSIHEGHLSCKVVIVLDPVFRSGKSDLPVKCISACLDSSAITSIIESEDLKSDERTVTSSVTLPVYLACTNADWPRFKPLLGGFQHRYMPGGGIVRMCVPDNPGPVFPHEPNHWKRTLDLAIESLIVNAPPPSVP